MSHRYVIDANVLFSAFISGRDLGVGIEKKRGLSPFLPFQVPFQGLS